MNVSSLRTISNNIDILPKKVILLRLDLNVPLDIDGNITEYDRILKSLPTIKLLAEAGAKVVIISHLGRPKGEFNSKLTLFPIYQALQEKLTYNVHFVEDSIGNVVKDKVKSIAFGEVLLLENVRFYTEEENNDNDFAMSLSELADIYVSDAFATSHRAHASTEGVAKYLSSYAGLLMEEELKNLNSIVTNPQKPFVALIGGAKVSSKIDLIYSLLDTVDTILIGGGMAATFAKAKGIDVGTSLVEDDKLLIASEIISKAQLSGVDLLLPEDCVVANTFSEDAESRVISYNSIPKDHMVLDIGPITIESFNKVIKEATSFIWNGPVGVFEWEKFANGSLAIAKCVAFQTKNHGLQSIIGGGDSVALLNKAGVYKDLTYVSTAGGAFLEFVEGKNLPGVKCLLEN